MLCACACMWWIACVMDDPECVDTCERIISHFVWSDLCWRIELETKTVQSRGIPTAICLSLGKSASAQQVLQEDRPSLFPGDVDDAKFYLGNSKGQKISGMIEGIPWTLEDYFLKHGIASSKCKFYMVKVCLQANYVLLLIIQQLPNTWIAGHWKQQDSRIWSRWYTSCKLPMWQSLAANHCENATKIREAILLRENVVNSQWFATFRLKSTSNPLRITVKTRRKLTVNIHSETLSRVNCLLFGYCIPNSRERGWAICVFICVFICEAECQCCRVWSRWYTPLHVTEVSIIYSMLVIVHIIAARKEQQAGASSAVRESQGWDGEPKQ